VTSQVASSEAVLRFRCYGGDVAIHLGGEDEETTQAALADGRARLLAIHRSLSRFLADSELTRLNGDPSHAVPASPLMRMFVRAAVGAARRSGGLVDATQIEALERAGYRASLEGVATLSLDRALAAAGAARRPAGADPRAKWRSIGIDRAGAVLRPPGLGLDSGGIAKGLAADLLATGLRGFLTFAVDCAGDIRMGGSAGMERRVQVDDPFGGAPLHEFGIRDGAVATSGIGRRAWLGPDGSPAHHLLNPATGQPAFTGVVQATALAPTAQLAEVLAKTALLSGPQGAAVQLPHGGCIVLDDGSFEILPAASPAGHVLPAPPDHDPATA
jgi:thiamine biosynthesis lipoprotein